MRGAHLHSVGFPTTDVRATTAFDRLLGPSVPDDDAPVVAANVAAPPAGKDFSLTWGTTTALEPLDAGRVADPTLRAQIEIGYDDAASVDQAWRAAISAGHPGPVEPHDAPWGVRFAVLSDPDGNRVACTAPLTSNPQASQET